jgi:DNA-binding HxlR family transcriptional regulator
VKFGNEKISKNLHYFCRRKFKKQKKVEAMNQIDLEKFEVQRKKVSGKWKSIILLLMLDRPLKFNKIKQLLPKISSRMLSQCLKEMETDGLIYKTESNNYLQSEIGSEICHILALLNKTVAKLTAIAA